MKKKLIILAIIGYGGSSFPEGLPSPFKENPFGAPPEESPFESHSNFAPPPQINERNDASPFKENPFGAPSQESPFSSPFESHSTFPAESQQNRPSPFGPAPEHSAFESPWTHPQHAPADSMLGENSPFTHEPEAHTNSFHESAPTPWSHPVQSPQALKEEAQEDALVNTGVDNFDKEASGNWVLKRVWWQKIQDLYEQIKQVFNDIMAARMNFVSERNRLDRELDTFFSQIGLEEGQLQDTLDDIRDFLKKERAQDGFLDKSEEAFYQALQGKERDLEQIKLDSKALQDLDQKIDEALDTLFKQIDVANKYEQKAWETFKEVAQELDDNAARTSYFQTEGLLKDIQNVHSYIITDFSSYFSQVIQSAQTHAKSITMQMQNLKESGVDLKKRYEALEQTLEAKEVAKEVAVDVALENKKWEKKEKAAALAQPTGVVTTVKLFVLRVADSVLKFFSNSFSSLQKWFSRKEASVVTHEEKLGVKLLKEEKKGAARVDTDLQKAQARLDAEQEIIQTTEHSIQQEQHEAAVSPQLPKTFTGLVEEREHANPESHQLHEGFEHNPYDASGHTVLPHHVGADFRAERPQEEESYPGISHHPVSEERLGQSHERAPEERSFERRPVSVMPQREQHEPLQEREQLGRFGATEPEFSRPEHQETPAPLNFEGEQTAHDSEFFHHEPPITQEPRFEEPARAEYPVSPFQR